LTLNNISSLKTLVKNILLKYSKGEVSYLWDITHCVEISSIVCSAVFNFNLNFSNDIEYSKKQLQLSN
jgi:hypothetical protein